MSDVVSSAKNAFLRSNQSRSGLRGSRLGWIHGIRFGKSISGGAATTTAAAAAAPSSSWLTVCLISSLLRDVPRVSCLVSRLPSSSSSSSSRCVYAHTLSRRSGVAFQNMSHKALAGFACSSRLFVSERSPWSTDPGSRRRCEHANASLDDRSRLARNGKIDSERLGTCL